VRAVTPPTIRVEIARAPAPPLTVAGKVASVVAWGVTVALAVAIVWPPWWPQPGSARRDTPNP
jgi:hypothetical protein